MSDSVVDVSQAVFDGEAAAWRELVLAATPSMSEKIRARLEACPGDGVEHGLGFCRVIHAARDYARAHAAAHLERARRAAAVGNPSEAS